jgi:hypothetical protein
MLRQIGGGSEIGGGGFTETYSHGDGISRILYANDFTDITGWGIGSGTAEADSTYVYDGTVSAKLTGSASNLYWSKPNLGFSVDATVPNTWFRLIIYMPEAMTTGEIYTYFYSGNSGANTGTDYVRKLGGTVAAGWHVIDLPVPSVGNGTYVPTNVTGFGIQFTKTNGIMYVDSLQVLRPATTDLPTFVLTFDDGYAEHATVAAVELEKYGWKGTFSVVPTLVAKNGYTTIAQLQAMDLKGHIIANHSYAHLNWLSGGAGGIPLTTAEKEYSILRGKRYLQENGLGRNADIFTWAYGFAGTQAELDMALRLNRCCLNTGSLFVSRLNMNPTYNVPTDWAPVYRKNFVARSLQDKSATQPFNVTGIDARISAGKKGATFAMIHQLDGAAGRLTQAEFIASCAYLRAKEMAGLCRVISLSDWLSE